MATVLMPLADRDFDVTEVAIPCDQEISRTRSIQRVQCSDPVERGSTVGL